MKEDIISQIINMELEAKRENDELKKLASKYEEDLKNELNNFRADKFEKAEEKINAAAEKSAANVKKKLAATEAEYGKKESEMTARYKQKRSELIEEIVNGVLKDE